MSPGNKSSGKAKDRVTLNCALRERRILIFFVFFRRIAGVRACLYVVRSSGGGGRATYLERSSSRCILCALLRRCITLFFHCHTQKMDYLGTGCFLCPGTKEYIHVYKIPAIFFTTKRMNGKIVPIRFFFYFQTCFSFPNVTHACLFFFFVGEKRRRRHVPPI